MTYSSDDEEEGESFRIFRTEFLNGVHELTKKKCWVGSVIIKRYMRQSNNDVYEAARAYVNDREGARSDESDSSSSATPKKAARPKVAARPKPFPYTPDSGDDSSISDGSRLDLADVYEAWFDKQTPLVTTKGKTVHYKIGYAGEEREG